MNIEKISKVIARTPFVVAILTIVFLGSLSAYLYWEKLNDNNLLLRYQDYVQRLQSQAADSKADEIAQEIELERLRNALSTLSFNLTTKTQLPVDTEDNPVSDYQELEEKIRERIIYERELENANKNLDSRLDLIKEVASLDPSTINEIMSLQRQFGPFIQALNVNDERMEEIVGVLNDYVAEQSQARQQILLKARSEQIDRRQVGTLMRAVMDQELMYEELFPHLSRSEISLLQQTHAEQENQAQFDGRPPGGFRGPR